LQNEQIKEVRSHCKVRYTSNLPVIYQHTSINMLSKAVLDHTISDGHLSNKAASTKEEDDGSSVASRSSISATSTGLASTSGEKEESGKTIQEAITKKESAAVLKLRILVIFILLATAVAVCVVIFWLTQASQEEEFQTQYSAAAQKLVSSVSKRAQA
jgi:hypothetical protein